MLKPYVNVLTHGHHTMNVISQRCIVADRRRKNTHSIVYVNSAFKILYRNTHTPSTWSPYFISEASFIWACLNLQIYTPTKAKKDKRGKLQSLVIIRQLRSVSYDRAVMKFCLTEDTELHSFERQGS